LNLSLFLRPLLRISKQFRLLANERKQGCSHRFWRLWKRQAYLAGTLERMMSRNISCHHRGFRLGDCRSSSAGRRPGAAHLLDSTADRQPHMSEKSTVCAACDCVDDDYYYSPEGAGPFCGERWASLTDADRSLLLEKRLEQYEAYREQLRALLLRAADAIPEGCRLRVWRPRCLSAYSAWGTELNPGAAKGGRA
jgi:hypothetical protein